MVTMEPLADAGGFLCHSMQGNAPVTRFLHCSGPAWSEAGKEGTDMAEHHNNRNFIKSDKTVTCKFTLLSFDHAIL